ncbi:hypothetical protein D9758_006396 [Tetrapyrgos nigripes]|uniref:Uncharacterized protein n=1 Tax=Tetrapyrgos nigripes TaxID=182062 RepID=A0A8H5D8C2_9AGAR|nr:hypothetical protein D9758_006396 [Tetrapyrgos nigripes]
MSASDEWGAIFEEGAQPYSGDDTDDDIAPVWSDDEPDAPAPSKLEGKGSSSKNTALHEQHWNHSG